MPWHSANIVRGGSPRRPRLIARFWRFGPTSPKCTTTWASSSRSRASSTRPWHGFEQAIALRPDFADAHNNLGNVLLSQGKLDEAAARYEHALALRPDYAEAHNNLGIILWQQGKLDEAAARYEQALALRPDYADAHYNLGNVLLEQGKLDEAAARFEQALALRPDYAEAHNNLGNILWKQGKLDEAAARFEQALALRPDLRRAHNNLGNVLLSSRVSSTKRWHVTSKRSLLRPDYAEAHYNLGSTLSEPGQARRSGGTLRASAGSPAGLRRRAIGPGHLLFGRRGLRAWLACV